MYRLVKEETKLIEIKGKYTTAKIMIDEIEMTTALQIYAIVNHPVFTNPIYIMPDAHAGAGTVIGFTMEMSDKIIADIVGRDINCGLLTFEIEDIFKGSSTMPGGLKRLCGSIDREIRRWIPFGTNVHTDATYKYKIDKEFPWDEVNEQGRLFTMAFNKKYGTNYDVPKYDKDWFRKKCEQIKMDFRRAVRSIGTLGGGKMIASSPRG